VREREDRLLAVESVRCRLRGKKRNRGNRVDGGAGTAELLGEGDGERRRGRRTGPRLEKKKEMGKRRGG
jgi:hypothetical protein